MPVVLSIPNEYGYVLLTAVSSVFVNIYHGNLTSNARKASKITYPNAYASAQEAEQNPLAFRLNCAQRAHANFTENLTPWMAVLFIAGLRNPITAASLGAGWLVSRVVYAIGYTSSSGPKGRIAGSIGHYLTNLSLTFMAGYTGYKMVMGA